MPQVEDGLPEDILDFLHYCQRDHHDVHDPAGRERLDWFIIPLIAERRGSMRDRDREGDREGLTGSRLTSKRSTYRSTLSRVRRPDSSSDRAECDRALFGAVDRCARMGLTQSKSSGTAWESAP